MNRSNVVKYLVYMVIGLAIVGLGFKLINNPEDIFRNIFIFVVIAGAIYIIYNVFMNKRDSSSAGYKKAVKQTKKKYGAKNNNVNAKVKPSANTIAKTKVKPNTTTPLKKKRKIPDHLTVIEGNKGKRKDRRTM